MREMTILDAMDRGNRRRMPSGWTRAKLIATLGALLVLPLGQVWAQQAAQPPVQVKTKVLPLPKAQPQTPAKAEPEQSSAAHEMADVFSQLGGQIYEDCIFELSEEQMEVQQALIQAYVRLGADNSLARQLAVKQIRPPRLSAKCEKVKGSNPAAAATPASLPEPGTWAPSIVAPDAPAKKRDTSPKLPVEPTGPAPLADKKVLPNWDCAPGVDYVTITHKGYERKLSAGEICSPFEDVVRAVPDSATSFKLGYTIRTGRLFVISEDANNGRTIAWAISGRDVCRNNPDPDCLAARAIGPLPPGEYNFASKKEHRVSWGPKTRRMVSGIWLSKLWYKEKYSTAQTKAILARGNIAIHVRLRGEMSEACLGLGEKGWAYVSQLIKDGRATGVNVYIDEPHPKIAENPPIVRDSNFSLSSLFKQ
jgi:hypothetical protein